MRPSIIASHFLHSLLQIFYKNFSTFLILYSLIRPSFQVFFLIQASIGKSFIFCTIFPSSYGRLFHALYALYMSIIATNNHFRRSYHIALAKKLIYLSKSIKGCYFFHNQCDQRSLNLSLLIVEMELTSDW